MIVSHLSVCSRLHQLRNPHSEHATYASQFNVHLIEGLMAPDYQRRAELTPTLYDGGTKGVMSISLNFSRRSLPRTSSTSRGILTTLNSS